MTIETEKNIKTTYHCPTIHEYGNIAEITKALGTTSMTRDAAGGGNNKTF